MGKKSIGYNPGIWPDSLIEIQIAKNDVNERIEYEIFYFGIPVIA